MAEFGKTAGALFVLIFVKYSVCLVSERTCPACSEFDYVEKTLQKLKRTEISVNQMKTDISKTLNDFRDIMAGYMMTLDSFPEQYERLKQRIDEELKKKAAEIQLLSERIDLPMIAFNAFEPANRRLVANQIICFITAPLNSGEGYNTSTGYFTAPVGGLYQFSGHICTQLNVYVSFAIVLKNHNGTEEQLAVSYADEDASCTSVSATTIVEEGERVYLKAVSATATVTHRFSFYHTITSSPDQLQEDSQRRSSFIGMLLRKSFGRK